MAVEAKYGVPLQVPETDEKRARIKAIADRERISQAQVVRDIIEAGLAAREALSEQRAP